MVAGCKEELALLYFVMAAQASLIKKNVPTKIEYLAVCYLAIAA